MLYTEFHIYIYMERLQINEFKFFIAVRKAMTFIYYNISSGTIFNGEKKEN